MAELFSIINAKFVAETPGDILPGVDVQMATLSETFEAGMYELTVSLVTGYTTANDKFEWHVEGSFTSPEFIKQCKDPTDNIPVAYTFPTQWAGGLMTVTVFGEALDALVNVAAVNIIVKRIG